MKKTADQIRKNMRRVKNKDTFIELKLRKALWREGYRYRKNYSRVYGTPDICFHSKKVAIFCDSNFWHGKDWDSRKNDIMSNRDFWVSKIERNIKRDSEVNEKLNSIGWTVIRFWEDEILKETSKCIEKIEKVVKSSEKKI